MDVQGGEVGGAGDDVDATGGRLAREVEGKVTTGLEFRGGGVFGGELWSRAVGIAGGR